MSSRLKYIQLAGDALIPLLGFFIWDWSLYFILIYYVLDLFIGEILMYFKSRQIIRFHEKQVNWFKHAVFSLLLFIASVFLVHSVMGILHPEQTLISEFKSFWTYEELGIQQGYILVPILILAAVQKYRFEFLMTGRYRTLQLSDLWKKHLTQYPLIMACSGIALATAWLFSPQDVWYLISIIVLSSLYRSYT
jgi:hypothetical protein